MIRAALSARSKNGEGLFSAPFPLPPSNSKQFSVGFVWALKPSNCAVYSGKLGSAGGAFSGKTLSEWPILSEAGEYGKKSPAFDANDFKGLA